MIDSLDRTESAYAHGTYARYRAGCRCVECKAANSAYAVGRYRAKKLSGDWNGLVNTHRVRIHIEHLRRSNVGLRAIADAASIGRTCLSKIMNGSKKWIRARTQKAILAVDASAIEGGALVDPAPTLGHIRLLLSTGMTRGEIAQALGLQTPALQIGANGRMVTARNAMAVERLLLRVLEEESAGGDVPEVCADCGYSHRPENRQRLIRRMAAEGVSAEDISESWPCFYGGDAEFGAGRGYRMLMRDLAALRAAAETRRAA